MDIRQQRVARKFKLSAEDVAALFAAGLDNPHKIKEAARADKLPEGLKGKLTRYSQK